MHLNFKCPDCEDEIMVLENKKHVCSECDKSYSDDDALTLFEAGKLIAVTDEETANKLIEEAKKEKVDGVDYDKLDDKEDKAKKKPKGVKEQKDDDEEENDDDDDDDDDEKKKNKNKKKKVEIDVKEDVDALFNGETLSEEFKVKAATIFKAAVSRHVTEQAEIADAEHAEALAEVEEEAFKKVDKKVSEYMNYMSEEWMSENKLVLESEAKYEINKEFIDGMVKLIKEHYVEVPEGRYDILEGLATEVKDLKDKLNAEMDKNIKLSEGLKASGKEKIVSEVMDDLADTDKEKFTKLVENVEYKDDEQFTKEVNTLKESYFKKGGKKDLNENLHDDTKKVKFV